MKNNIEFDSKCLLKIIIVFDITKDIFELEENKENVKVVFELEKIKKNVIGILELDENKENVVNKVTKKNLMKEKKFKILNIKK